MSKKQRVIIILFVIVALLTFGIAVCVYISRLKLIFAQLDLLSEELIGVTVKMLGIAGMVCILLIVISVFCLRLSEKKVSSVKRKEKFLTEISHEIRTPLNSLLGLNQLMQQNTEDREKLEEYIGESKEICNYLILMMNNILDMAKLEQRNMVLEETPFSLERMLCTVETVMRERILAKNIDYRLQMDWINSWVIGDEVRLQQVLVNILENAVKFTPENGKIQIDVTQEITENQTIITIFQIKDTGCGISEEFINHIFDSYAQERQDIKSSMQGTGLGMAISYRLMKEMGGNIMVTSKQGEGSCFTVVLPARMSGEGAENLFSADLETVDTMPEKKNVLVAEDDRLNAEILMEILKKGGYGVSWAENGQEVLKKFQNSELNEIDVILMDLKMPVMNGYETAKAIRLLKRADADTVRIYACTAGVSETDEKKARECGMNGYVAKPIHTQVLFKLLNKEGQ